MRLLIAAVLIATAAPAAAKPRCLGAADGKAAQSSRTCLTCHDGAIAATVTNHLAGAAGAQIGAGHPVGVSYSIAFLRKPSRLQHPAMLDKRINLVDGKVQCVSCHDLSSTSKAMLVMPNRSSALCSSCHRM
jgi:predicted CXXCH cytochrome family protein